MTREPERIILAALSTLTLAAITLVLYVALAGVTPCPEHQARQDTLRVIYGMVPQLTELILETTEAHEALAREIAEHWKARER